MKSLGSLLLIVCLGLVGWRAIDDGAAPIPSVPSSSLFTALRGDLKITVTENGYLKAKNSLNLKPEFERQGTISWLIEEGEEVKEGDVLVEFDKTELEDQINELETSLIQYEMEHEAGEAELGIQERDNETVVEKAELALEIAKLKLERYERGEAPNELRLKDLAVDKAKSEHSRAKVRADQAPALQAEGFMTELQVEDERLALRVAEINLENMAKELELFLEYSRPMEMTQFQTAVKDATREVENATIKAAIRFKQKKAAVTQQQRRVDSTTARIEQLGKELGFMTIVAPQPGLVHYGDPARRWMHEQIKIGNTLRKGNTIITLPDLRVMQVLIQVHEADIDLVTLDMPVLVTIETHKGVTFPAKVTDIATVAASSGWNDSTNKSFRVEVTMDPIEVQMRAGVTARAEVQVAELTDVLQVPIHAIRPEGDIHYCFVYMDGTPVRREVTVGNNNAHRVEVLSGLEEGDRVLLYDPRESEIGDDEAEAESEGPAASMGAMGGSE
ncbi:MAG: HlyD family secretion protein [Candidatus Paceibacteria bacterium]|jgi:HlyD family secretion protein